MELYTLEYALAVADTGSFSRAAEQCCVGQPALSQQIAKLEKELGVALFIRHPKGAVLTEAGEAFAVRAREILQKRDALRAEMSLFSGVEKGTLSLGIITSLDCVDLGGLLAAFCQSHPGISVNIVQGGSYDLLSRLQKRSIDVAIINKPSSVQEFRGALGGLLTGKLYSSVTLEKLGEDFYALAVPQTSSLASCSEVSLQQLAHERFLFHQTGQVASELCLMACHTAGFEPEIVCRSSSPTTTLYLVKGGLGIAFLPEEEFSTHTLEGVVKVRLTERIVKEVCMAYRKDAASPLLDTFICFAREWIAPKNETCQS